MAAFDFLFTLFGLVLGLAMAEALGGSVRALKAQTSTASNSSPVRVGWLSPLLTLIVVLDLITCWGLAWSIRTHVPLNLLTMVAGTAFVAVYYVVAGLLWPDEPRDWSDIDGWFDRHKALVGILLGLANVGFSAISVAGELPSGVLYVQLIYIALLLALAVTRSRRQSLAVLIALVGVYVWTGLNASENWNLSQS